MTNLEMVAAELDAAKKKHPHFVDSLFPPRERYSPEWYDDALDMDNARGLIGEDAPAPCFPAPSVVSSSQNNEKP